MLLVKKNMKEKIKKGKNVTSTRNKKKKDSKGFTLIEIIGVIIIIGIIMIIGTVAVSGYIESSKARTYESYKKDLEGATENLMIECISGNEEGCDIPEYGRDIKISYNELVEKGYSDRLKDPEGEGYCDTSYVIAKNNSENGVELEYQVCLYCSNYKSEEAGCEELGGSDSVPPTCDYTQLVGASTEWTKENKVISIGCSDGESGCQNRIFSNSIGKEGEVIEKGTITIRDNAGNTKICPNNQTIRIAGPPSRPTINLNGYTSATWTNQNVTITMSSSSNIGIDHYEYSHDGTNWINDFNNNPTGWQRVYHNNNKTSMSVTISWEGNWNFYIRAVDKNGNVSPNSIMFTVRIDKTPPVVILNKVNILQTNSSGAWINFFFLQGGQCNYALCQNSVFDSWQLVNVVGSLGMSFEMTQTDNLSGVIANTGSYNWDMYDLDKNIYISSCLSSQGNRRCRWTQRYTVRDAAGNTSNTATAIVYMHYP